MKKLLYVPAVIFAAAVALASCEKSEDGPKKENATVSIKADASFAEDNTATVTLTLSASVSEDVIVTLAKSDVQAGKTEVPVDFDKSVKISKGKTSVSVKVEADVMGLESGDYQAAVAMTSAKGAELGSNSIVYINLHYAYKPEVNIYADAAFSGDKTAEIRVALSKATTKDVTVELAPAANNAYTVSLEPSSLTIVAGQTEAKAVATVTIPEGMVNGKYQLSVEIVSVMNAIKGKVTSATIGLTYPFAVNITLDGDFEDWENPNVVRWTLPEGTILYPMLKDLRLAGNEKYVYMYFEFADPGTVDYYCASLKDVVKGGALADNSLPINIYIDCDASPKTGAFVAAVDNDTFYPPYAGDNMGIEWYVEGAFHSGNAFTDFTGLTVYKYGGNDNENVFSGLSNMAGQYDGSHFFGVVTYDESQAMGKAELQFSRTFFNIKGNEARFCVKIMDMGRNWDCLGLIPQGVASDMKNPETRTHVDMAKVNLPDYVE